MITRVVPAKHCAAGKRVDTDVVGQRDERAEFVRHGRYGALPPDADRQGA